MQDQAFRYSPNAYGLPVLEKRLHIPRNDPMEQSDYIIFSSHQCTVMVPDGKGQNPVFNSVLTLTLKFKDVSDEIDGDIYKCGFLILCNEMGQHFWKLCILSEPVFTKDNTKSFLGERATQRARDTSGF